jgi:hypothetical protein
MVGGEREKVPQVCERGADVPLRGPSEHPSPPRRQRERHVHARRLLEIGGRAHGRVELAHPEEKRRLSRARHRAERDRLRHPEARDLVEREARGAIAPPRREAVRLVARGEAAVPVRLRRDVRRRVKLRDVVARDLHGE